MDVNYEPSQSSMEASYTVTATHERGFTTPADLSDDHKQALLGVLRRAKVMLLGEHSPRPTSREQEKFHIDIFHMWQSTSHHSAPDAKGCSSGLRDRSVEVAVLDQDVPSDKEVKDELKRRGLVNKITKQRAYKHLIDQNRAGVQTNSVHRRRGAPVLMRAQLTSSHTINTQFLCRNGAFLSCFVKKTWLPTVTVEKAHSMAFQRFDQFETVNVNSYNLKVAVFIARNRITHWANGHDFTDVPPTENMDLFVPAETIRLNADRSVNPLTQQAYADLDALPEYTIYQGLPSTEDGNADNVDLEALNSQFFNYEDANAEDANAEDAN